jgi:hypothetical protein
MAFEEAPENERRNKREHQGHPANGPGNPMDAFAEKITA